MNITLWPNGMTTAFDGYEQVGVAQKPWIILYVEYLKENGIDPLKQNITLGGGKKVKFFETEEGYNFEVY